jgi:hypothetical protein
MTPREPPCDECGGSAWTPLREEGHDLLECTLCGALAGPDLAVTEVLLARQARERGVEPVVFPLVQVLEKVPRLHIVRASAGHPIRRIWPVVFLSTEGEKGLRAIERLAKSLALHSRDLRLHWFLEVEFQERLLFLLQPRLFHAPAQVGEQDVLDAQHDLGVLARLLDMDMKLQWWSG